MEQPLGAALAPVVVGVSLSGRGHLVGCYSYGVTGKRGKGSSPCMLHEREMFHSGDNYCAFHQCLGRVLGHSHSQDGNADWESDSFFLLLLPFLRVLVTPTGTVQYPTSISSLLL